MILSKIKSLWLAIGIVIGIALAILIFLLYTPSFSTSYLSNKGGVLKYDTTYPNLEKYRKRGSMAWLGTTRHGRISMVLHDRTTLNNYLDSVFVIFSARHQCNIPKGFVWEVGIYPNVAIDSFVNHIKQRRGFPKLNFYFIPTLARRKGELVDSIIDFYDLLEVDPTRNPYDHYLGECKPDMIGQYSDHQYASIDSNYVFDQGTLFP